MRRESTREYLASEKMLSTKTVIEGDRRVEDKQDEGEAACGTPGIWANPDIDHPAMVELIGHMGYG